MKNVAGEPQERPESLCQAKSFWVERFDATSFQLGTQLGEMFVIPRFDCAQNVDDRDVGAGKGAIVDDLFNAGAGRSDLRCKVGQTAWPITNNRSKSAEAAISDKTQLDYPAENVRVDVATAKKKNAFFSSEIAQLSGEARRQWGCRGPFHDGFLHFDQS